MRGRNELHAAEIVHLPRPAAHPLSPTGFTLCPIVLLPGQTAGQLQCQQALYRWALEQAQAVARPSVLERDLIAVRN